VEFFSQRYAERYQRDPWCPDAEELQAFVEYHWPGNVRQLSHVIEQAYVLNDVPHLPTSRACHPVDGPSLPYFNLDRLRATAVRQALQATGGHKGKAARLLGVHANTLTRLLTQIEAC
jgi:DNA-binding NtrC family response regulator